MGKTLIARGQATIHTQTDAYTLTLSLGEYVFPAAADGKITSAVTLVSTVKVTRDDTDFTGFTIGAISKPTGFSSITTDNTKKTVTYTVAANTTTLAEHGKVDIPVLISGVTYHLSFVWSKAKAGSPGAAGKPGVDANLLDWVKDWNTGKTVINGNSLITPKLFAGKKNTDGTLTGVAIGRFPLSTKTAAGTVATETVDGIYGFKDGYKTFFIDNGGNVQLGRGNQFIKYNAATGKVEFGSEVSLLWKGATYIDKDGIFTGTLSATTVKAVKLDASQITSGTISAARIDVNTLKASLITAGNINALTLDVTKGRIGGWQIDSDSIFRGTKNNTAGAYTSASGSITIGSNGIRGYKWRLDTTGAGAIAGGNISWDAAGKVTFAASVSVAWTSSINSITTALGGSGYAKLTKIDAKGIYTGTVNASQITAGTISADRIASGSIKASKLDAASIKADIINTGYINGLSLTFTKGKIGGWAIGSGALTGTHITLDSVNKRVVVYGANSGATNGQRVQLYYSSDTSFGFYATDKNGTCIAQLGSSNQIAGWVISSAIIKKGNVQLGSDGSITNNAKWKLNNDGSGQIASGNISWDAAGKVTFSSAVSLLWKNDIEAAKTTNYGYRYYKKIVINGESGKYYPVVFKGGEQTVQRDILIRRSYNEQAPADWDNKSTTHKGGLILLIKTNFGNWGGIAYSWDIYELSETYSRMFAGAAHCGNSCMFAVFLRGGGTTGAVYHLYSDQPIESSFMSPSPIPAAPQIAYNSDLIFQSGSTKANAPAPRTLTSTVEEEIRRHRFIKLAQGNDTTLKEHPLTYISSTGIYTGTLTASQVNAVSISASSIKSGTLSADRIATGSLNGNKITARTITADRIVSQGITANEIKARSITADRIAASTITSNEIASRTITAAKITASTITSTEIASRTITASNIKSSAITANEIASRTITAAKIATSTITANEIASGTITASKINVSSIQAAVVTASAVNALQCAFTKGTIGGFSIEGHKIWCREADNGNGTSHYIEIHSNGYICNARSSDNADYWALNRDGSAAFGLGKIYFGASGDGWLANKNITWDASGNVTIKGSVTATSGKIAGFNISGNKLLNTASDSSIQFSSMLGSSSLYINSGTSLISMRADSSRTGINIQTYASGARGIYIIANAGSKYAIEAYGPIQLGQRNGERWCVPGVLYIGCKYQVGYNNYYRKIWGEGVTISSFSHIGDGKYRVYHNLKHTQYTVQAILWSSQAYYGFFRLLEKTTTYFVIQNIGAGGKPDQGAFDFIIMGRNVW